MSFANYSAISVGLEVFSSGPLHQESNYSSLHPKGRLAWGQSLVSS